MQQEDYSELESKDLIQLNDILAKLNEAEYALRNLGPSEKEKKIKTKLEKKIKKYYTQMKKWGVNMSESALDGSNKGKMKKQKGGLFPTVDIDQFLIESDRLINSFL